MDNTSFSYLLKECRDGCKNELPPVFVDRSEPCVGFRCPFGLKLALCGLGSQVDFRCPCGQKLALSGLGSRVASRCLCGQKLSLCGLGIPGGSRCLPLWIEVVPVWAGKSRSLQTSLLTGASPERAGKVSSLQMP